MSKSSPWSVSKTSGPFGRVFWINENTGATQFEPPASPTASPTAPPPTAPPPTTSSTHNNASSSSTSSQKKETFLQKTNDVQQPKKIMNPISPVCLQCSLFVHDTDAHVIVQDRRIHATCFLCYGCNNNLTNINYMEYTRQQWCVPCYEEFHAPRCSGCKQICRIGESLVINERCRGVSMTYHVACLEEEKKKKRKKCYRCDEIFFEEMNESICPNCVLTEATEAAAAAKERAARSLHIPGREVLLCARASSHMHVGSGQLYRYDEEDKEDKGGGGGGGGGGETFVSSSIVDGQVGTALCSLEDRGEEKTYMISSSGSLLRLTELNGVVVEAEDVGILKMNGSESVVCGGLRGACCVGGGLLCLAPRGTLESSDRDCIVWVDVVEVRVHMLLQMESCDAVDMDVRPLGGGVGASMDVFIWSNSSGLMRIKLSLMSCWSDDNETGGGGGGGGGRRGEQRERRRVLRCVDLLPMTWVGPVDSDSRPPPGVVTITFIDERRLLIIAPRDPNDGLMLMLTLGVEEEEGGGGGERINGFRHGKRGRSLLKYKTRLICGTPSSVESMTVRSATTPLLPFPVVPSIVPPVPSMTSLLHAKQRREREEEEKEEEGVVEEEEEVVGKEIVGEMVEEELDNLVSTFDYFAHSNANKVKKDYQLVEEQQQQQQQQQQPPLFVLKPVPSSAAISTTKTTVLEKDDDDVVVSHSPNSLRQKLRERLRRNSRRGTKQKREENREKSKEVSLAGGLRSTSDYSPNQVAKSVQETKERMERLRAIMMSKGNTTTTRVGGGGGGMEEDEDSKEVMEEEPPPPPPTPPSGFIPNLPPGTYMTLLPPPPSPPPTPPGGTGQTPTTPLRTFSSPSLKYDMESSQKSPMLTNIADRQRELQATMRRRAMLKLGGV